MDITIADVLDKNRQLQEITDWVQQKHASIVSAKDAEIASLKAIIAANPNVATQEQLNTVFAGQDAVLEDLIKTFGPLPPDPD